MHLIDRDNIQFDDLKLFIEIAKKIGIANANEVMRRLQKEPDLTASMDVLNSLNKDVDL